MKNTQRPVSSRSRTALSLAVLLPLCISAQSLFAAPPTTTIVNSTQVVDLGGATMDKNGEGGYFVQLNSLTLTNGTIANAGATGGAGSGGGGGLGGAVFVNTGASLTINSVNFIGNIATGGAGGVGSQGGTVNGLFTSSGTGASGNNGTTPALNEFTDVAGTTGSKGGNGFAGSLSFGGNGGNGGNGGDGGNKSLGLELSVTSATLSLAGVVSQAVAAYANPFTINVGVGLTLSLANAAVDLANSILALDGFNQALAAGQIGLGGVGGTGGIGGTGAAFLGGGSGGDGGNGGKGGEAVGGVLFPSPYKGGAAGGDAGNGGTGGLGGFGAGGGQGGDGGTGGAGAASQDTPYRAAVPEEFVYGDVPETFKTTYTDPNTGLQVVEGGLTTNPGNSTKTIALTGGGTVDVPVTASQDQPARQDKIVTKPAIPEIVGGPSGGRPNGLDGTGGAGGSGGFGGGMGASGNTPGIGILGGNGGNGYGGAIFVRSGGSLTITGNVTFDQNSAEGGAGQAADEALSITEGSSGIGVGTDLFIMKGSTILLKPGAGNSIVFNGSIADDSTASGITSSIPAGQGAGLTVEDGLVVFNGDNTYSGQTKILTGGVLQAIDRAGLNINSNLNLAGGVFQSSGNFSRLLGPQSTRVQFTDSGGFAAAGGNLNVSLNNGGTLTWGSPGGFIGTGFSLLFGSTSADSNVDFKNAINLGSGARTILNTASLVDDGDGGTIDNKVTFSGILSNGSITFGSSSATGSVYLTAVNTYSGTTVAGGSLVLSGNGTLNSTGTMTVASGADFDISLVGNRAIGDLAGAGTVYLGSNTLTINQSGSTTFSGEIADGGVGGGTSGDLIKQNTGTLTLSGNNTYTGDTDIKAGTLVLSGSGQLASPKVTVFTDATLTNSSGGLSSNASLTNNGLINQNSDDTVASLVNTGTINGTGTLTAATYALNSTSIINANLGNGTVTANGTVALNGTSAAEIFDVVAGTTTLGGPSERLLDTTALSISSGATLILGGAEKIGSLTGAGSLRNNGSRLSLDSGNFSGVISEGGGLTKVSSGNLTLSGNNTYSGSTLVDAGKLILTGSLVSNSVTVTTGASLDVTTAGLASDTTLTSNGTTTFTADETINTLNGSGFVALTDTELTLSQGSFSGVISDTEGAGTLTKVSAGTLTLSGNNTYTGDTNVDAGTLDLTGSLESLYVYVAGGSTLNDVNGGLASGSTLENDGLVVLSSNDTITTFINTGTLNGSLYTLTAATYALNSTSVINANLGNGTVTANGTVALNGTSAAEIFDVVAGTTTLGSTERLLDTTALSISSGATVILGLNAAEKIGSLTGAGSLRNNGSRLTLDSGDFSGVISEGGGLTKLSSGNLTLSGANSYTGSTLVDAGKLILSGSLVSNSVTVTTGASLDVTNAGLASDTTLTSNGTTTFTADETINSLLGSGFVDLTDTELTLNQGSFSGVISDTEGAGTLTKVSSGTLTLSGNNTYTGDTNIDVGTLTLTGSLESLYVHVAGGTVLNDVDGGLASGSTLNNDGTVVLSADDTVQTYNSTNTINGAPYTLTAATYGLNDGSQVNAKLGNGTVTANGTVALNGTSAAETFDVVAGTTTLGDTERLLDTTALSISSGATLVLGGAEKIGSLTGAGSLNNDSGRLSLDSGDFSGVISGSSGVTKLSSGNLTLSGENIYTGSTLIEAGKLILSGSLTSNVVTVSSNATLDVTNAGLASDTALGNNGTINLSIDETVATYTSTGTLNGPGKLNAGSYILNNGSVVNANLGAGNLTISGTIDLFGTSDSLDVTVTGGSTLNLQGEQRLASGATLTVDGTLALAGGNQSVRVLQGSGIVDMQQNRFTVTGTGLAFTGNYIGSNTTIVADGGTIDLTGGNVTSNSTTATGNGTINVNDGGLVITKITDVTGNSTITVGGNSTLESSTSITIDGGSRLEIVDAGSSVTTATLTVNGVLYVIDSSSLDYDTLRGNGTIDTDGSIFVNVNGSRVKGFLTFTGDFTNQGTLAPGASPGLINIAGNYTEAGTLQAELQTTTPITGHDQIRVGGTVTLQGTSTLVVQTFGGVQPVRGSVYQVIANSVGGPIVASGAFGAVTFDADGDLGLGLPVVNAATVFDQATGQVIATGLNATGSTFAGLGATANQGAAASALLATATGLVGPNQINTATNSGFLARQLIVANGGSSTNLARFTPEYYGALADYAFSSDSAVTDMLLYRVSTLADLPGTKADGLAVYAGVLSNSADTADNADLNRTDLYAGADYAISPEFTLGLLVTKNDGDISATFGKSDVDGMGVRGYFKSALSKEFLLVGSLGYENNSYDTRRTTTDVVKATGTTDGTAVSGMLGLSYLAWTKGELSLVPRAALTYSHASIDGFTENGANDRLILGSYDATRLTGDLGASLVWSTMLDGQALSVEFNLGLEQKLVDDQGDQTATVVTSPTTSFKQTFADDEATNIAYGVRVGYNIYGNATIYAGYEGRASTDSSSNVNAGLRVSF